VGPPRGHAIKNNMSLVVHQELQAGQGAARCSEGASLFGSSGAGGDEFAGGMRGPSTSDACSTSGSGASGLVKKAPQQQQPQHPAVAGAAIRTRKERTWLQGLAAIAQSVGAHSGHPHERRARGLDSAKLHKKPRGPFFAQGNDYGYPCKYGSGAMGMLQGLVSEAAGFLRTHWPMCIVLWLGLCTCCFVLCSHLEVPTTEQWTRAAVAGAGLGGTSGGAYPKLIEVPLHSPVMASPGPPMEEGQVHWYTESPLGMAENAEREAGAVELAQVYKADVGEGNALMLPIVGGVIITSYLVLIAIYRAALHCERELQPLLQSPTGPAAAVIAYTLPQDHEERAGKRFL